MSRIQSVVCLLVVALLSTNASSQEAHLHGNHAKSDLGPSGGKVQTVGTTKVETIIRPGGIAFTVLDAHGNPVAATSASGKLKLKVGTGTKEYTYDLKPLKNHAIGVVVNLKKVEGHMLHMNVALTGFGSQPLSFHAMGKLGELSDSVLVSLQGVCPVSGQKLGSMGTPPKIMVKGKPLFICCAGCKGKLEASPDQYLAKFYGPTKGEEVRPGIFKATLADTRAIAAQKTCPVMDEPLGGMGTPLKVDVKGKAVFICCAGCAKKLNAAPEKYLQQLADAGIQPPAMK